MAIRRIVAEKLLWETLKRWKHSSPEMDRIQFLKTVPFFNELSMWQLKKVSEIVFERSYEADEMIFEQGQPGAAIFLVIQGQVAVEIFHDQADTTLAVLERGSFFGEMALLDESPRSASARAIEPTKTLALYRNDLTRLIQTDPQTACHIYRALARIVGDRLRGTNELVLQGLMTDKIAA
ncbi:MAG TPA: cyclic nucleotide-binding domain-containing protein [Bdellovibrionales bacterium]|nr:cyclic nucleotide-binding domain-containing protein [Bdellovibrionales bacterium]